MGTGATLPADANRKASIDWLLQRDTIDQFVGRIGKTQRQVVSAYRSDGRDSVAIFSALMPASKVPAALQRCSWDLSVGEGLPGFVEHYEDRKPVRTYHSFGDDSGIRPLVIEREFHGARPRYPELCEEFRLFHNLAYDHQRGRLLAFDESGYEVNVADVAARFVDVDLGFLKRFLSATGLTCAVYFDIFRYSDLPLSAVPEADRRRVVTTESAHYCLDVVEDFEDHQKSFSRLCGKVFILPGAIEESGVWPFEKGHADGEVTFIIGTDENGNPVTATSDPEQLDNHFGKNPGAPHYLTPVFFRRDVLTKYYADPKRYRVSDGMVQCLGLWSMRLDNDTPNYVVAFLGDLGRDLPLNERRHWRSANIPPAGGISRTNLRRSFLGEFADPESPDLRFRQEYAELIRCWQAKHGWSVYRALDEGDEHLLDTVRVPITLGQNEIDEQVLTLAKLLIDGLDEREIVTRVGPGPKDEKGISKLDRFFEKTQFPARAEAVLLLRSLQQLRSSGSAHRKGENYRKAVEKLKVDANRPEQLLPVLLERALHMMQQLGRHYLAE